MGYNTDKLKGGGKKMEKIKTGILLVLSSLGLISLCLLTFYLIGAFWYITGSMRFQGEIAFLPKWIFLFSIFALLGYTERVKKFLLSLNL
jgi:hypothetical protein